MTLDFFIIGRYMAWKVGLGAHVNNGNDVIVVCGMNIFLHEDMVEQFRVSGRCTLNRVGNHEKFIYLESGLPQCSDASAGNGLTLILAIVHQ